MSLSISISALAFEPVILTPDNRVLIHPNGVVDQELGTAEQAGGEFCAFILTDITPGPELGALERSYGVTRPAPK